MLASNIGKVPVSFIGGRDKSSIGVNMAQLSLLLLVGACAGVATALGGTLAIRFRSAQKLLFSFSGGAVIGVALLDLLPEALNLAGSVRPALGVTTAAAGGFAGYFLIHRLTHILSSRRGVHSFQLGPASLSMHSLMDGLGIGLAFQVSAAAGVIVAIAVVAHDFLDGANTVILSLASGQAVATARRWLIIDAFAPLMGIVLACLLAVPESARGLLLAVFAGGFLYIGASELLPRSHDEEAGFIHVGATGLGLAFIYVVVRLAGA